jgi:hypothetical protein
MRSYHLDLLAIVWFAFGFRNAFRAAVTGIIEHRNDWAARLGIYGSGGLLALAAVFFSVVAVWPLGSGSACIALSYALLRPTFQALRFHRRARA